MKKVALYIPTLYHGGAERVVSRLSFILRKDFEVFIILDELSVEYEVGCDIISLDVPSDDNFLKKISLPLKRARKLKQIKEKYGFDCVISFLTNANIVNGISRIKSCSTVFSIRNFLESEKNTSLLNSIKDFLIQRLYGKVEAIVPVSEELANSLVNVYKVDKNKIEVIYNPYDIKEITEQALIPMNNELHQDFFENSKVFISVGRLSHQKGHWHLIKAFSLLPKDGSVKLVIIGTGEKQEKIRKLIEDLGLQGRVLLALYQKNPFQYLKSSYAYVLTSLYEGFPNALTEAMACGLPVVASDCKSGPKEILFNNLDLSVSIETVVDASFGLITPELEKEENWDSKKITKGEEKLAIAMQKLLINKDHYDKYAIKAKNRAKDFSYEICLRKYSKVIEQAIRSVENNQ